MTLTRLAYGSVGMDVELPDSATVIAPRHRAASADPAATLREAIVHPVAGPPLAGLVRPGQRVAISVCDVTRPQPRELMVEAILEVLDGTIRPDDVVVLIATGTHRTSTPEERLAMLGPQVLARCRVIDHDARDDASLVDLGMVGDVPVRLAREWVEADLRITTGFVEPHFFAGFSGGPKMVAPGLAGLATTLELHNARRIGDPRATWGVIEGNPVHDAVRAIAATTGVAFALDVLLNDEQRITRAFGGEILAMHALACAAAREEAMRPVDGPFDIVITTNSGYPLDQNLYQAVKGMSAAAEVVREGGTIICAAECRDGLPDHGPYGELLRQGRTPAELLANIAASPVTIPDQWQVQIQARVLTKARVLLRTDGLSDEQVRAAHLEPIADVGATVAALLASDPGARICVLPQGPQTIPYLM
jgi:nickel-dependent lactate racemase